MRRDQQRRTAGGQRELAQMAVLRQARAHRAQPRKAERERVGTRVRAMAAQQRDQRQRHRDQKAPDMNLMAEQFAKRRKNSNRERPGEAMHHAQARKTSGASVDPAGLHTGTIVAIV